MDKNPARNASPARNDSRSDSGRHNDAGGEIAASVVHKVPEDLRRALISTPKALTIWEDLTPLARNEWICWVVSVKKQETRVDHIRRVRTQLLEGKRRPCCWAGCMHRSK